MVQRRGPAPRRKLIRFALRTPVGNVGEICPWHREWLTSSRLETDRKVQEPVP